MNFLKLIIPILPPSYIFLNYLKKKKQELVI